MKKKTVADQEVWLTHGNKKFDSGVQCVTFFKHNGFRFNERKQVNNNKAPKSRIVLTLTDLDLSKLECLLDSGTTGGSRVHF